MDAPATTTAEQTRQYMLVFYVGLYCIYWHDWISTLGSEYKRIWKADWTVIKGLYIITRYSPLILSILVLQGFNVNYTEAQCRKTLMPLANALPLLVQATVSGIVMIRCYAIWNRNKWILAFFLALQASQSAVGGWLVGTYIRVVPFPGGRGPCIYMISRPTMTVGCILSVIFDFSATGLLVYRAYQIKNRVAGGLKSDILSLVVRHGALYALGLGLSVVANLTFGAMSLKYNTPFRGYPGSNFCTIIAASLACRLVLSLRESDEARGWSTGTASASGVVISHGSSDRSSRTKIGSKLSNKLGGGGISSTTSGGGVQIQTQTMQAYCSDSSGTVHLTSFPGDEKDAADSCLELNELEKKQSINDAKREFELDVEKGRM
ncbi:hypothetical protein P389DRAFT_190735 [Cystobasidium minutum MCA 4210]|uniref:uncharacterized protein n=1 Tax=Cystobasidium minutum MCA 4210 TaxID=1397322 RepID=UPI0034CFA37A|eukprot:jgi/Rhomi1/190735/estExt_fgenesh1_pg.C_60014